MMPGTKQIRVGEQAPDFTIADVHGNDFSLSSYQGKKNVVLVFLRYQGCPLCQMTLQQLKNAYNEFESRDAEVAAFVQSPARTILKSGDADAFPFRLIPDPDERIYKLFGIGIGGIGALLAPKTIDRALRATLQGHRQGRMEGNTWQLPGEVIIDKNGVMRLARVGKNMGDSLAPSALLSHL